MVDAPLALGLVLAVLVFWLVGVYNRLMRLRARALDAFGSLVHHLMEYRALLSASLPLNGTGADAAPWQGLLQQVELVETAVRDATRSLLAPTELQALVRACADLQMQWTRLRVTLSPQADWSEFIGRWEGTARNAEIARGGVSKVLARYNEAIGEFPASLVAALLGFKPAGAL